MPNFPLIQLDDVLITEISFSIISISCYLFNKSHGYKEHTDLKFLPGLFYIFQEEILLILFFFFFGINSNKNII